MRWTPPRRAIALAVLGFSAYACTLVATLPATFVDAQLAQATRGIIRLADARGTLWSGTGRLEVREKDRRVGGAYPLTWRFQPRSLLRGRLVFAIGTDDGRRGSMTAGFWRIEFNDTDIVLPAAVLGLGEPRLAPLKLGGELSLHIVRLAIASDQVSGSGTMQWRHATSALTRVAPLGDYELSIRDGEYALQATMRTLQGPLQIDGNGSWTAGAPVQFAGNARVPLPLEQQLAPLLRLLAVEQGPGVFAIQFK